MPLECSRCRAEYAQGDAFCRKCGASLSASAETALVEQVTPPVVEGEVIELGAEKPKKDLLSNPGLQTLVKVGSKAGEKLYQALQSETGKKLTRGATTIALTIGTELASRAVKNMVAPEKTNKPTAPQPKSLTEQLLNAIQNTPNQPEPPAQPAAQEEIVVIERFYRRRVYRRTQE